MAGPVQRYEALLGQSDFVFIVFYRGHWCPFCISWLKSLQGLTSDIKAAKGTPIIVTAEAQEHLSKTLEKTRYNGEAIVDPQNELAATLKTRGLVTVAKSKKSGYPHGMAQPAVLVQKKDGTVLYSWAINPSMMNIGGAKDRPLLGEIWDDVQGMLDGRRSAPRSNYTKMTMATGLKEQFFGR